ncbi:hypothetical protein IKA15_00550 [bacterium]|nr:hypothetical protein [bacterium]
MEIEQKLLKEDKIIANFKNNQLVADAVNTTVNIFKKILGGNYLPSEVHFTSFKDTHPKHTNALGIFCPDKKSIGINADFKCFDNFKNLKRAKLGDFNFLLWDNEKSTLHPLHTFIHEFAHCAHYKNLLKNGNTDCWNWLGEKNTKGLNYTSQSGTYGKYSTSDLKEYFAEVMTKEILENVPSEYPSKSIDTSRIDLRAIKPEDYIHAGEINTYHIWTGNKAEIEKNLGEMVELNSQLTDVNRIIRSFII